MGGGGGGNIALWEGAFSVLGGSIPWFPPLSLDKTLLINPNTPISSNVRIVWLCEICETSNY